MKVCVIEHVRFPIEYGRGGEFECNDKSTYLFIHQMLLGK